MRDVTGQILADEDEGFARVGLNEHDRAFVLAFLEQHGVAGVDVVDDSGICLEIKAHTTAEVGATGPTISAKIEDHANNGRGYEPEKSSDLECMLDAPREYGDNRDGNEKKQHSADSCRWRHVASELRPLTFAQRFFSWLHRLVKPLTRTLPA